MSKLFYLSLIICCIACAGAEAQTNALMREGNMLYDEKRYKDAANVYNKAVTKNPTYSPGMFNLGNALYQQKQFDATRKVMENAAKVSKDKDTKGEANYTIGNTYMEEKKWEDAIEAYKNALRNNPRDADAKYNLSYAEEMLKKNQQGGGGKNKKDKNDKNNKQDQKQQDKDKQDKDKQNKDQQNKDQQNKDQQNKDKQDKDKDQQDQQHPQGQPSKLSQQQADQLLNALQQEEKKLQDKNQKEKGIPVKMDKDW